MGTLAQRWVGRLRNTAQTWLARGVQLLSSFLGRFTPSAQTRIVRWVQLAVEVHWKSGIDDVSTQAAAMTYAAVLSLLPLLLLGLAVTGALVRYGVSDDWFTSVVAAIPGLDDVVASIGPTLASNATNLGVIGLVAVLWTGSVLTSRAQAALAVVFAQQRRVIVNRARALGITIALGICLIGSVAFTGVIMGLRVGGYLTVPTRILAGALLFLLELAYFTVTYWLLTPDRPASLREHLVGGIFMAIGWTGLKYIGNLFVDHTIAHASALYGTIGAVFGVMLGMRVASWLYLYGAEITSIRLRERAGTEGIETAISA